MKNSKDIIRYCLFCSLLLSASFQKILADGAPTRPAPPSYLDGDSRSWDGLEYDDDPWVFNTSRPFFVTEGLQNRHLSIWASHGRYYDSERNRWKWQRPLLFCTSEDLFTQTIVIPYLIPMLQNAGAIVFTPRERDWQRREIIIDNDDTFKRPYYEETVLGKKWKQCDSLGFAAKHSIYIDGQNPFKEGTARQAKATKRKRSSYISYQPNFQEAGRYAVYVSYQTLPKSVSDAKYLVCHKGQITEFTVNQRMGGGTWVYLGTFDFDKGCNEFNRVLVTNHASQRGVVTSDAVRFGGGMGNIERGDTLSGLPRCLEGARYYAQWAGAPYNVYGGRKGASDYADDINTRSLMTNWLGGGSIYMPALEGKKVPFELSLAVHSDAGYQADGKSTIGSLAVCTTNFNDGMFCSGVSRYASKDFAEALLKNLVTDMRAQYGSFNERYLWDRNYSETRIPEVPSAIIEMLSHQNFPDMKIAQDPMGKFNIARSLYKTILRYVSSNHGRRYTVQPLAPNNFSVELGENGTAQLSWTPQFDSTEPSAVAKQYVLYTAEGKGGFDNGTIVKSTQHTVQLEPGKLYSFKVTAINSGGESFPSETLAAYYNPEATKTVMIVNNFHRLAAPQVLDNDTIQGFDLDKDPGVTYGLTAGWSGKQLVFSRHKMGHEGSNGLGFSGEELVGKFIAGNDFNYTVEHARAIAANGFYNIASCSSETVLSGKVSLKVFQAVDLINGLERNDGYTPRFYKSFSESMQKRLKEYTKAGGALLVSGSYTGSDMTAKSEKNFLKDVLKVAYEPTGTKFQVKCINPEDSTMMLCDSLTQTTDSVMGLGMKFPYRNALNEYHYAATHPEVLKPATEPAFCAMQYLTGTSAAVGYKGNDYTCFTMGFPFECITEEKTRNSIMAGVLKFLLEK